LVIEVEVGEALVQNPAADVAVEVFIPVGVSKGLVEVSIGLLGAAI
jgi:hypothetical protein